jgi:hypothetical protein
MQDDITPEEQEKQAQGLRVMKKACRECLFTPNRLVSEERKNQLIEESKDSFFICHEGTQRGQTICCRNFYERYKDISQGLKMAQFLNMLHPGMIQFVEPEEEGAQL